MPAEETPAKIVAEEPVSKAIPISEEPSDEESPADKPTPTEDEPSEE